MPLNQQEAQLFVSAFQKALGQFIGEGPAPATQSYPPRDVNVERLYVGLTNLVDTLDTIANHLAMLLEAGLPGGDGAAGEPRAPRKRGPKPKGDSAAQSVAGAAQQPNTPSNGAGPPPVATPLPIPGTPAALTQPPADDPLSEAAPMPDFLNRTPAAAAPAAPPPQLTEQQMKDTLRQYMQRHGEQGTARLTNLLQTIGGVKRFSELAPDKWPAVLQAANTELRQQ